MSSFTKPTEIDTGETAEYYVMNYFHWNFDAKELSAHMSLYKSQAAFEAGKTPMKPRCVKMRVRGADFDALFSHSDMGEMLTKIVNVMKVKPNLIISDHHRPAEGKVLVDASTVITTAKTPATSAPLPVPAITS